MKWIESMGGPLVVVEERLAGAWRGTDGLSAGGGGDTEGSDYDRACAVGGYVGRIACGNGDALVLGDEPLPTACIAAPGGAVLIRWVYADDEASIENAAGDLVASAALDDDGLRFRVSGEGGVRLFDAADPGDEISGDSLVFPLAAGTYAVSTAVVDISDEVQVVVHQLSKIGATSGMVDEETRDE